MNIEPDELGTKLTESMYVVMREDPDGIRDPEILGVCKKRMSIDKIRTKLGLSVGHNIVIKGPIPLLKDTSFNYTRPDPLKPEFNPNPFGPDFRDPKFSPPKPGFIPKVKPFKPEFPIPKGPQL